MEDGRVCWRNDSPIECMYDSNFKTNLRMELNLSRFFRLHPLLNLLIFYIWFLRVFFSHPYRLVRQWQCLRAWVCTHANSLCVFVCVYTTHTYASFSAIWTKYPNKIEKLCQVIKHFIFENDESELNFVVFSVMNEICDFIEFPELSLPHLSHRTFFFPLAFSSVAFLFQHSLSLSHSIVRFYRHHHYYYYYLFVSFVIIHTHIMCVVSYLWYFISNYIVHRHFCVWLTFEWVRVCVCKVILFISASPINAYYMCTTKRNTQLLTRILYMVYPQQQNTIEHSTTQRNSFVAFKASNHHIAKMPSTNGMRIVGWLAGSLVWHLVSSFIHTRVYAILQLLCWQKFIYIFYQLLNFHCCFPPLIRAARVWQNGNVTHLIAPSQPMLFILMNFYLIRLCICHIKVFDFEQQIPFETEVYEFLEWMQMYQHPPATMPHRKWDISVFVLINFLIDQSELEGAPRAKVPINWFCLFDCDIFIDDFIIKFGHSEVDCAMKLFATGRSNKWKFKKTINHFFSDTLSCRPKLWSKRYS